MKKLLVTITIVVLLVTGLTGCSGSFGKFTLFQIEDGTASVIKGSSKAKESTSDASCW